MQLWLLAHPRVRLLFELTYALSLNLIEPRWKSLRSLALKGRRFEELAQLLAAIYQAAAYWNVHRQPYVWRKAT